MNEETKEILAKTIAARYSSAIFQFFRVRHMDITRKDILQELGYILDTELDDLKSAVEFNGGTEHPYIYLSCAVPGTPALTEINKVGLHDALFGCLESTIKLQIFIEQQEDNQ